jgi:hypothetical protein
VLRSQAELEGWARALRGCYDASREPAAALAQVATLKAMGTPRTAAGPQQL